MSDLLNDHREYKQAQDKTSSRDGTQREGVIPTEGWTSLQTLAYLQKTFPEAKNWYCWVASSLDYASYVARLILRHDETEGQIGPWQWIRIPFLSVDSHVDDEQILTAFSNAHKHAPSILILEEIDSLIQHTPGARATLLNQLDGFESKEGVLVIATTNNPEKVDPALIQRPSRFDRVWRFELPDYGLRYSYLADRFPELNDGMRDWVATKTDKWSFAYIQELRNTAALLAIRRNKKIIEEPEAREAVQLLSHQFFVCAKQLPEIETASRVGFEINSP